ncbi:MAG: iron hydrogenase small subunit [Synergistaceae bacterium]|nr:iron hydrogenase small subunit [Synergistaceae bacterium]
MQDSARHGAGKEPEFFARDTSIKQCYKACLGEPLGEKSHHLMHTDQSKWELWK